MKLEVGSNERRENFPTNVSSIFSFFFHAKRRTVLFVFAPPCVRFWRGAFWINYNLPLPTSARGPPSVRKF